MDFNAWKRWFAGMLACALALPCASAPEPREWVLGQSAPLSGPFGPMGQDYRNGALLAFDDVNRHGGVQGRPIRLVSLDDGYQVDKAVANAHALIDEHKVLCFFNHAGSATVLATIPIAAAAGVPYVGPYTGHADLYRGTWPQLFVTRASFADEFDKIFDYLATIGYRRIALVTYDNRIGEEQRRDVDAGLRQRGRQLMVHATMSLGGSAQAAVARIGRLRCCSTSRASMRWPSTARWRRPARSRSTSGAACSAATCWPTSLGRWPAGWSCRSWCLRPSSRSRASRASTCGC